VNWADLMAAQGAFGTDFYEIRLIHSAPSLGQSIQCLHPISHLCYNERFSGVQFLHPGVLFCIDIASLCGSVVWTSSTMRVVMSSSPD